MTAPLRPDPRRRTTLRSAFTERLGLKAIALCGAVLLWAVAGARQPVQAYVRVKVAPVLDSSLVMRDEPQELRALVLGKAADVAKLYVTPPTVQRIVTGDAPDTLVLDVTPADVHVPAELVENVRVLDVEPRVVTLRFEAGATRRVPVVSDNRVIVRRDSTVIPTSLAFEPRSVLVTGPRRAVHRIASVRPFSLTIAAGDTLPHVADLDTTGLGVRLHPAQVRVTARCSKGDSASASTQCLK